MALAIEQRARGLDGGVDYAVERDVLLFEFKLALRNASDIQQIVQQPRHVFDLALYHALRPLQLLGS